LEKQSTLVNFYINT